MYIFAWTKPWKQFDVPAVIIIASYRLVHLRDMMCGYIVFTLMNRRMLTKQRRRCNMIHQKWSITQKLLQSHRSKTNVTHKTMKTICLPGYHPNDYHNSCTLETLCFFHGLLFTSCIMLNTSLTCSVFLDSFAQETFTLTLEKQYKN